MEVWAADSLMQLITKLRDREIMLVSYLYESVHLSKEFNSNVYSNSDTLH